MDELDEEDGDTIYNHSTSRKRASSFDKADVRQGIEERPDKSRKVEPEEKGDDEVIVREKDEADYAWLEQQLEGWDVVGSREGFLRGLQKEVSYSGSPSRAYI